jgi:hypothetical protein
MQRPDPGQQLRGLRHSLTSEVLPALPDGAPHRQLKAALHLIERLERTWDLVGPHLLADNADIETVLRALLPPQGERSLSALTDAASSESLPSGYNDPDLRAAARRNLALHHILLDMDDCSAIRALHGRMVDRDALLVGDRPVRAESAR